MKFSLKRSWLLVLVTILVVLAVLLAVRIVGAMDYRHNDNDFFTFWLAGAGYYILLKKADGVWRIDQQVTAWIS